MKRVCPHCGAPMYHNVCEYCKMPAAVSESRVRIQTKNRNSHMKLCLILLLVFAVVILGVGATGVAVLRLRTNSNSPSITSNAVLDAHAEVSENDTTALEKMQESGVFTSGTYLVGEEIPAGEYVLVSESSNPDHLFYAGIYADREEEQELSGNWHEYSAIVQLEEGTYFHFSWAICYDVTKNTVLNDPTNHPGMFCVGCDIEPGTYTICPYEGETHNVYPTYAIYTELGSVAPVIAESGSLYDPSTSEIVESVTVTVEEGQYLYLKECVIQE
ncbi:MAG: hypothetical protein ACI4XB_01065 [Ruminococcus sp.]